ncbi:MAG TPA: discoidin domain-containing protein [Candidatus Onthovicinus excrementipullorum]|nr:discoidin domain-containing protein [Candidatus Onthovicinus excrementipullorum]
MKIRKIIAALSAAAIACAAFSGCAGPATGGDVLSIQEGKTENLALNAPAAMGERDAAKAVDGDRSTAFCARSEKGTIEIDFGREVTFDTIVLREKGWNIRQYHIDVLIGEEWETIYIGDRIEDLRYCALEQAVTASGLRLIVDSSNQVFSISEIEVAMAPKSNNQGFRVSAYVRTDLMVDGSLYDPDGGVYLDSKFLDVATELNFLGCVNLDGDGNIVLTRTQVNDAGEEESVLMTDDEFAAALERMRTYIGDRDVQLTMTIGTPDPDTTYRAMTESRDALIANIMDFAGRFGFDGISFDWERPQNQDQFNAFSDFLIELKPRLTEAGMRLTLAWASWGVNMKPEAVKTADAIEIMSYDLFDQYGNQASFLESTVQAVDYFLSLGYDKSQLNIGIPYYGRPVDGGAYWPSYSDAQYQLGRYDDTDSEFVADYGQSYFNSYQTVMDKTAYAISEGLGGVMVFRLELDRPYDDPVSLTKAIGNTIAHRIEGGDIHE